MSWRNSTQQSWCLLLLNKKEKGLKSEDQLKRAPPPCSYISNLGTTQNSRSVKSYTIQLDTNEAERIVFKDIRPVLWLFCVRICANSKLWVSFRRCSLKSRNPPKRQKTAEKGKRTEKEGAARDFVFCQVCICLKGLSQIACCAIGLSLSGMVSLKQAKNLSDQSVFLSSILTIIFREE